MHVRVIMAAMMLSLLIVLPYVHLETGIFAAMVVFFVALALAAWEDLHTVTKQYIFTLAPDVDLALGRERILEGAADTLRQRGVLVDAGFSGADVVMTIRGPARYVNHLSRTVRDEKWQRIKEVCTVIRGPLPATWE